MKLLYRSLPFIDECFYGYIGRLAYWNGFKNGSTFLLKLRYIYKKLSNSDELSHGYFFDALESVLNRSLPGQYNWNGSVTDILKNEVKICSLCWSAKAYIRFYWRYEAYSICHKHNTLLLLMSHISYDPNFDVDIGIDKYRKVNASLNCKLKGVVLGRLNEASCNHNAFGDEIALIREEIALWDDVVIFMKSYFLISFNFESVFEIVDKNSLILLPAIERFEMVRNFLLSQQSGLNKLINVIVIVQAARYRRVVYKSSQAKLWFLSEAYAISPVLFAYLAGIGPHIFANETDMYNRTLPKIPLWNLNDRMVCKFILESSILSDCELDSVWQEGKNFSTGRCEPQGCINGEVYDYQRYIDAAGNDIFERTPCRRDDAHDVLSDVS